MKFRNKILLFVLLGMTLLLSLYLFIPGIYESLSKFFLGEYKPVIVVALVAIVISVVGFGVVFTDKPEFVEKKVNQLPLYDASKKMIIVREEKEDK